MNDLSFDLFARSGWQPRVDVYRCAEGWLVKLELAGVAEQDIRIEVQRDVLVVEGQRRDWCVPATQAHVSMEITYDWFRRTIRLPGILAGEDTRTEYRDGMLLIHLRSKR
jgi:HSP20 family protein